MSEKKKTLYHYTDAQSASAIREDGVIQPSSQGAFGGGKVYMTSINPTAGRKAIAQNNYGRGWDGRETQGSVDHVVKVRVPEKELTKEPAKGGRDIYTHEGPLKLKD